MSDVEGGVGFGGEVVGGLGASPAAVQPVAISAAGGDDVLQQRDQPLRLLQNTEGAQDAAMVMHGWSCRTQREHRTQRW